MSVPFFLLLFGHIRLAVMTGLDGGCCHTTVFLQHNSLYVSALQNGLFDSAKKALLDCGTGFLRARNSLFRKSGKYVRSTVKGVVTTTVVYISYSKGITAWLWKQPPVCHKSMSLIYKGRRQPSRDAKFCVSRAVNAAITGILSPQLITHPPL